MADVYLQNSTTVRFILFVVATPMLHTTDPITQLPEGRGTASATRQAGRVRARGQAKGQQTRTAIVEAALGLATHVGLEGLSIGAVAEVMQMSKSGVFAHFGSREELQISVVREYHQHFEEEVFFPAVAGPRGLPRLRAMFANWMKRTSIEIEAGCIYISGAVEFDDRPGPVRDALASSVKTWLTAMNRAVVLAKKEGHLRADVDEQQMTFEIHGLILALHYEARFLKTPGSVDRALAGFERIVKEHQTPAAPPAADDRATAHLTASSTRS